MDKKRKNDILSGFHSVYEALKAGRREIRKIFISEARSLRRVERIIRFARKKNIEIEYLAPELLDRMTESSEHQGIVAHTSFFPVKETADILLKGSSNFILVLEGIQDPYNLGALIRTGVCAGVDFILIPKKRAAFPSPAVSRSSAGAMEHADIYMITNTVSVIKWFKKKGIWITGLDASGDASLFESDLTGNIALVIGGEHMGIRPGVKKECDFLVSIPVQRLINSLNASVAGGVAIYEACRQRKLNRPGKKIIKSEKK